MNNIKDLSNFYLWMKKNDFNHNIRIRVEEKAKLYLDEKKKYTNPNKIGSCGRVGCENKKYKTDYYCLECTRERIMSGY